MVRYGFVRPDSRHAENPQRELLLRDGVLKAKIGDDLEKIKGSAKRGPSMICVTDIHRLASDTASLMVTIDDLLVIGRVVIRESRTGRQSDDPRGWSAALLETTLYFARRGRTLEEARADALAGRDASPVTKPKGGRMPRHLAQVILNDHKSFPTLDKALRAINRDKRYKTKWNPALVYRLRKKGKLKLLPRLSGRWPSD